MRLTRLVQGVALLAAIKLGALGVLWVAPDTQDHAWLSMSTEQAQAAAKNEKPAAKKDTKDTKTPNATEATKPANATAANNATSNATAPEAPAKPEKSLAEQLQDVRNRQSELGKKDADLHTLEQELDKKLENLKALEAKMQKMIEEGNTLRDEKMRHLVDVYSNMKPKQAAGVLETLDESIAVRILAGMSGRKAGEILSSVTPVKAAKLSEALTKLQAK